jgi:hypothetical protein
MKIHLAVRRLAHGLTGWITFQARARRQRIFRETSFYVPLYELAQAQGWEASNEYPIGSVGRRGSPRRIDFLLSRPKEKVMIGLEVKFIPKIPKVRRAIDLSEEIDKLQDALPRVLASPRSNWSLYKYIFVCGACEAIEWLSLRPPVMEARLQRWKDSGKPKVGTRADEWLRDRGVWQSEFHTSRSRYGVYVFRVGGKTTIMPSQSDENAHTKSRPRWNSGT